LSEPSREAKGVETRRLYEDHAYVLDILPHGRTLPGRPRHLALPVVQVVGESYFTLLEAELKANTTVTPHERIYVGKERREKINRVIGRISYEELTAASKAELVSVLEELVRNQEKRFIDFFNSSQPITPRMHSLELLPGIGKKSMWHILNERERKTFDSFDDLHKRASIGDPVKLVVRRIMDELSGESKYRIFTRAV